MRIAYLYFMTDEPQKIRAVAPAHAAYWRDQVLPGYVGGPFADRSGGLIIFEAPDRERAERLVSADPFVRQDLLANRWIKEWTPE
jgi:uncharacterized protein YciI